MIRDARGSMAELKGSEDREHSCLVPLAIEKGKDK